MLVLSWPHRWRCAQLLAMQLVLTTLALAGLALSGLAIDYIAHNVEPATTSSWLEFLDRLGWSRLSVIAALAGAVLLVATFRAVLAYRYAVSAGRLVHHEIVADLRAQIRGPGLQLGNCDAQQQGGAR